MKVFGLTGGIACGKSTVSSIITKRNVPVIDADEIARTVVVPGSLGLQEIVNAFGQHVLLSSGELDRKKLASVVFADQTKLFQLNSIMHPKIAAMTKQLLDQLSSRGHQLACYDAALIIENRLEDRFRPLVVVACSEFTQITRLMHRDNVSEAVAKSRLAEQLSTAAKVAKANIVIFNDGDMTSLERRTDAALQEIFITTGLTPP